MDGGGGGDGGRMVNGGSTRVGVWGKEVVRCWDGFM